MLWRSSRGRPVNASAAFIHPCQPTVATKPPTGPGWAHELKHDGYRLQIHVQDGRVRLCGDDLVLVWCNSELRRCVLDTAHRSVSGSRRRRPFYRPAIGF